MLTPGTLPLLKAVFCSFFFPSRLSYLFSCTVWIKRKRSNSCSATEGTISIPEKIPEAVSHPDCGGNINEVLTEYKMHKQAIKHLQAHVIILGYQERKQVLLRGHTKYHNLYTSNVNSFQSTYL